MPRNFYRRLRNMLADRFIKECGDVRERKKDHEGGAISG